MKRSPIILWLLESDHFMGRAALACGLFHCSEDIKKQIMQPLCSRASAAASWLECNGNDDEKPRGIGIGGLLWFFRLCYMSHVSLDSNGRPGQRAWCVPAVENGKLPEEAARINAEAILALPCMLPAILHYMQKDVRIL